MKFIIFILLIAFINTAYSKGSTTERHLHSKERYGILLHRKGKYEKAYDKLYDAAQWGMKDSQYFLGLMYLKGQFVEQDIVKGMGYIGVANEADIKGRKIIFDTVYSKLPKDVKLLVDQRVKEYIEKIGMKAKSLKCSKAFDLGSRVPVINCTHYKRNIGGSSVD